MDPQDLVWDCSACGIKGIAEALKACPSCNEAYALGTNLYPAEGSAGEQILMGCWDCTSCDKKGLLGNVYECADCGAHRPEDVAFYLPDDAQEITDAAGKAAARSGADWQCEYCDQWVASTIDACPYCAGGDAETGARQEVKEEMIGAPSEPVAEEASVEEASEETPAKGNPLCCLAIMLALFVACVFFMRGCSTTEEVVVTGHSWKRTQTIQENKVVNEGGWTKPAGAMDVRTERRVHHQDKVYVRTERRTKTVEEKVSAGTEKYKAGTKKVDLGNGRFKKVPVYKEREIFKTISKQVPYDEKIYKKVDKYKTYYLYKIRKWVDVAPLVESGDGLEPSWPSAEVSGANRRAGPRKETYTVHLKPAKGKNLTYVLENETQWRSYEKGSKWVATIEDGEVTALAKKKK